MSAIAQLKLAEVDAHIARLTSTRNTLAGYARRPATRLPADP